MLTLYDQQYSTFIHIHTHTRGPLFKTITVAYIEWVTSQSDVKNAVQIAKEKYGSLNVAVNCAGIGIAAKRTLTKKGPHPLEEFQQVLSRLVCIFSLSPPFLSLPPSLLPSPPPLSLSHTHTHTHNHTHSSLSVTHR